MAANMFTCTCGCDNSLKIAELDHRLYLSFLSSDFYTQQGAFRNLKETVKLLAKTAISRKAVLIKDMFLTKEDVLDLKKAIEPIYLTNEPCKNNSFITISYCKDLDQYFVALKTRMSIKDILLGKRYKTYDMEINKAERDKLVRAIKRALAMEEIAKKKKK